MIQHVVLQASNFKSNNQRLLSAFRPPICAPRSSVCRQTTEQEDKECQRSRTITLDDISLDSHQCGNGAIRRCTFNSTAELTPTSFWLNVYVIAKENFRKKIHAHSHCSSNLSFVSVTFFFNLKRKKALKQDSIVAPTVAEGVVYKSSI